MELLPHPTQPSEPQDWILQWPRCVLLLQLSKSCTATGSLPVCGRLIERLLDGRRRLQGAPPVVESLLNELWYATSLASRGDLATARYHVMQAQEKARRVNRLILDIRRAESRRRCSELRRRSHRLQARSQGLRQRSEALISQSFAALCQARCSALRLRC